MRWICNISTCHCHSNIGYINISSAGGFIYPRVDIHILYIQLHIYISSAGFIYPTLYLYIQHQTYISNSTFIYPVSDLYPVPDFCISSARFDSRFTYSVPGLYIRLLSSAGIIYRTSDLYIQRWFSYPAPNLYIRLHIYISSTKFIYPNYYPAPDLYILLQIDISSAVFNTRMPNLYTRIHLYKSGFIYLVSVLTPFDWKSIETHVILISMITACSLLLFFWNY